MWEYNASATILYDRPTYSVLLYLKECRVTEPYYERKFPVGESNHRFHFRVIKLWEWHPEDIKSLGLSGLLPLMVLTNGGKNSLIFEEVVSDLETVEENTRKGLVSALFVLSALVMTEEAQKRWLKRKLSDMNKALQESWIYQLILQEGREAGMREGLREGIHEGLQTGLQQGMQQGMQQGREEERRQEAQRLRQILTSYVEVRFPSIARDARKHAEMIQDPDVLQQVMLKIYTAQTEEQTMEILHEAA
jgi:predicted transposase YdaD